MKHHTARPLTRREFISLVAGTVGLTAAGFSGLGCDQRLEGGEELILGPIEWSLITRNEDFYLTHVSLPKSAIDATAWSLDVSGSAANPMVMGYEQIRALEGIAETTTLVCIGNSIGGEAIGTAVWKGVPFSTLLKLWQVSDSAIDLVARGIGGYADSIPVAHLRKHFAMLAYEMNGVPLPHTHGFPMRIIVPGIYGIKNVKWLQSLSFVNYDFKGTWQTQGGWSDTAHVRPIAQIRNIPNGFVTRRGTLAVNGFAFAGLERVSRVEVSGDSGKTWVEAVLQKPLSNYSWLRWDSAVVLPEIGRYALMVRATVGDRLMNERVVDRLNGSEGWHSVTIEVADRP